MDLSQYDPTLAVDVTKELAEAKLDQNRLYKLPNGRIVKIKSFWQDAFADQLGSRAVMMTASVCDEAGQMLPGATISAPTYVRPRIVIGGETLEAQIDEGRRRWALHHGYYQDFWQPIEGVGELAPSPVEAAVPDDA